MQNVKNNTLKNHWAGDTDFLVLTTVNFAKYKPLFEKAYTGIFAPNFPVSAGYESQQDFVDLFNDAKSPIELKIALAGINLRDNKAGPVTIKGICVSYYYKESDTAMLMYLAVDPAYRTEGLGNALFKNHQSIMIESAKKQGKTLKGSYISLHDPVKPVTDEEKKFDTYDPQKRFDKYIAWGGVQVPMNYVYGCNEDGNIITNDECTLISFKHPVDGSLPSRETTLAHMRALWRGYGVEEPEKHPAFQAMVRSYKKRPSAPPAP